MASLGSAREPRRGPKQRKRDQKTITVDERFEILVYFSVVLRKKNKKKQSRVKLANRALACVRAHVWGIHMRAGKSAQEKGLSWGFFTRLLLPDR